MLEQKLEHHKWVDSEITQWWGKYHCTAGLQLNTIGFDQRKIYFYLYVCSEAGESKFVKLATSRIVFSDYGYRYNNHNDVKYKEGLHQCDQIGLLLIEMGDIFSYKSSPNK